MAFWLYIRDVFIAIAVLLVISGLVVSWLAFCLFLGIVTAVSSFFISCKTWRKK